jgi:hypothetical protein
MYREPKACVLFDTRKYNLLNYFISLSTIVILSSTTSIADEVRDRLQSALRTRAKAKNEYYNAVRKLGPEATREQKTSLQNKILSPAEQTWADAFRYTMSTRATELRKEINSETKRLLPMVITPQYILDPYSFVGKKSKYSSATLDSSKNQSSEKTNLPSNASDGKPYREITSSPKEEAPALDGSNIPKEVIFKGKKKKGQSPDPTPSPDAPIEGESKVDVIEFTPKKK